MGLTTRAPEQVRKLARACLLPGYPYSLPEELAIAGGGYLYATVPMRRQVRVEGRVQRASSGGISPNRFRSADRTEAPSPCATPAAWCARPHRAAHQSA